ncbi:MAG: hypothetical protein JNK87_08880 [Bryobacterales bacterium]|nr:hypothetical protein [Bryobacterales bacterium]
MSIGHFQTLLVAAALLLTGCAGKAPQNNKAVEDGVLEYLKNRKGLDINSMDVKVNSVTFRGNEADVQVSFTAKGASDTSQPMQMKYVLEQKDGKWTVKGRSNNEHTNTPPPGDMMPPSHPPTEGGGAGGAMPPGHPPTGGAEKK